MFFKEEVSLVQILLFQDQGILLEDLSTHCASNCEVHQVAKHCRHHQQPHGNRPLQTRVGMGNTIGSNGKEKRIARKEGCDDQSRLGEDDRKEDRVNPNAICRDNVLEAFVEMNEVFLKPVNVVHRAYQAGLILHGNTRDGRVLTNTIATS